MWTRSLRSFGKLQKTFFQTSSKANNDDSNPSNYYSSSNGSTRRSIDLTDGGNSSVENTWEEQPDQIYLRNALSTFPSKGRFVRRRPTLRKYSSAVRTRSGRQSFLRLNFFHCYNPEYSGVGVLEGELLSIAVRKKKEELRLLCEFLSAAAASSSTSSIRRDQARSSEHQ